MHTFTTRASRGGGKWGAISQSGTRAVKRGFYYGCELNLSVYGSDFDCSITLVIVTFFCGFWNYLLGRYKLITSFE